MFTFDFKDSKSYKMRLKEEIEKMVIPSPSKKIKFSMMQKLFAYWVKEKHYYGNWSGTGVGKTYAFILASRVIDSHLTVVIGNNSSTSQLAGNITRLYDDSVAVVYDGILPDFDMTKHNYLIFNYEKGQQKYSKELFDSVLDKYKVDYIVFDEVQWIKQSGNVCSSRRLVFQDFRNTSVERYDSYVSVLTATPYTNNISEVISILTLMTGEEYKVETKNILKNTIAVENLLNSLGVLSNTKPKNVFGKEIEKNVIIDEIEGDNDTFKAFKKSLDNGPLSIYQSTLKEKLEYVWGNDLVKKGELTILYTHFTNGIVDQTRDFFTDMGFKVCEYTGKKKDTDPYRDKNGEVKWSEVRDNFDIILSSKPISAGVDGLQKVCNNMVILSLPWTDSDKTQLFGRIYRNNSNFDSVNIHIPMVRFPQVKSVGYDDKVWNSILTKEMYGNAIKYGVFSNDVRSLHKSFVRDLKTDIEKGFVYAA